MKESNTIRLSFSIGMMETMVFFSHHGTSHLIGQHGPMAVLKRPHTLKVKKTHPVALMQGMPQVRLETRHGTQLPIDKCDTPFFMRHSKA